jgi:catechol 2,3-dioxygenase-like lactoylglutathione lyase family enzyme
LEVPVSTPTLSGLHHVTFPVKDLVSAIAWYGRVFGAEHLPALDHHDAAGHWFAAVLAVPGLDFPVQLRYADDIAANCHPPVTFAVSDRTELGRWAEHLDTCEVPHSPVTTGMAGQSVQFASPDGAALRLYADTAGVRVEKAS